jgi:archaellum component FlaG (FlaF/FlaG flagellin family)
MHTGTGTVALDYGTDTGTITVDVQSTQEDPKLCANPEHNFGTVQKGQTRTWTFDVTNCGTGTLTWTASDNREWITVDPTSGTDAGTVTVTINTASLTPGTHTGTVTVESNGGTKTGTISVKVKGSQPPPPPPPTSAEVPTFTPLGMLAMVGLLGVVGMSAIKRR